MEQCFFCTYADLFKDFCLHIAPPLTHSIDVVDLDFEEEESDSEGDDQALAGLCPFPLIK